MERFKRKEIKVMVQFIQKNEETIDAEVSYLYVCMANTISVTLMILQQLMHGNINH